MDVETQKLHLTLMDILLNYDLAQLDSTFPEIVQNPNRLCSAHFHLYGEHVSQYTKKHKHLEDLISSKIYQGLDHPITKKQLDLTTIQSIKLMEVITDQVEEFINDKTTIKKFGFTIVNKKLGAILPNYDFQQNNTLTKDTLIPWYSPVIICLHEPSQFCCLIDIDKLASKEGKSKFKTAYALDEYQELSNSLYNFICARNSDSRVFDAILESIDHQTLVNKILLKDTNLPPSFIRLLDHPTFKGYIELKKSIEELGDTE
uniref:hypothetical protein n=1 Tax=Navicula tsukamotoi TaxID=2018706 RepID=UPI002182336D|nr:hypothetical protein NDC64_pgp089 [Navicula tsukamotoi]UVG41719.1 hypothetical protein [Navicula tsukamotoi]UVG41863.1 hypothetical protein [Navicula tsukamotoi]